MKNLEKVPGYGAMWAIHHLKLYKERKYMIDEEQIGNLNRTLNLHPYLSIYLFYDANNLIYIQLLKFAE